MPNTPEQDKANAEHVINMMRWRFEECKESRDYYKARAEKLEAKLMALRTKLEIALADSE